MADSDVQGDYVVYAVDVLQRHFRPRQDAYVSGSLLAGLRRGQSGHALEQQQFRIDDSAL